MNKPVPTKFCPVCNAYHNLHYVQQADGKRHLFVECPVKPRLIAFVAGLNIPTLPSRKAVKLEQQAKQATFL